MGILGAIKARLALGRRLAVFHACIQPIKNNKIVFDNFRGKGYGDDPKYICEVLRKSGEKLDLVWLCKEGKDQEELNIPDGVRCVTYGTKEALYELASAHIWVDNVKNADKPKKRKGQFYIQTWHSMLGMKKNEQMAEARLDDDYIKAAKRDAGMTDLMYSNNDVRIDTYKNYFWYDGAVIKCGVPSCRVFFSEEDIAAAKKRVYEYFSLPSEKKIILYVPTFRGYGDKASIEPDYMACLDAFDTSEDLGGETGDYVFFRRLHPNLADKSKLPFSERLYNASGYPDVNDLIVSSAAVISDYSDCIFNAALAGKPLFMFAPDIDEYMTKDRALFFKIEELPFAISADLDMLIKQIGEFSAVEYQKEIAEFFRKVGMADKGDGDITVAEIILEKIRRKRG